MTDEPSYGRERVKRGPSNLLSKSRPKSLGGRCCKTLKWNEKRSYITEGKEGGMY